MKFFFLFIISIALTATCLARPCAVRRLDYDCIQIGDTLEKLESTVGRPYSICSKGGDTYEYEYVIKLDFTGKSNMTIQHYYFIVSNGIIVGKRFTQERTPAYNLIYSDDPNDYSY